MKRFIKWAIIVFLLWQCKNCLYPALFKESSIEKPIRVTGDDSTAICHFSKVEITKFGKTQSVREVCLRRVFQGNTYVLQDTFNDVLILYSTDGSSSEVNSFSIDIKKSPVMSYIRYKDVYTMTVVEQKNKLVFNLIEDKKTVGAVILYKGELDGLAPEKKKLKY